MWGKEPHSKTLFRYPICYIHAIALSAFQLKMLEIKVTDNNYSKIKSIIDIGLVRSRELFCKSSYLPNGKVYLLFVTRLLNWCVVPKVSKLRFCGWWGEICFQKKGLISVWYSFVMLLENLFRCGMFFSLQWSIVVHTRCVMIWEWTESYLAAHICCVSKSCDPFYKMVVISLHIAISMAFIVLWFEMSGLVSIRKDFSKLLVSFITTSAANSALVVVDCWKWSSTYDLNNISLSLEKHQALEMSTEELLYWTIFPSFSRVVKASYIVLLMILSI